MSIQVSATHSTSAWAATSHLPDVIFLTGSVQAAQTLCRLDPFCSLALLQPAEKCLISLIRKALPTLTDVADHSVQAGQIRVRPAGVAIQAETCNAIGNCCIAHSPLLVPDSANPETVCICARRKEGQESLATPRHGNHQLACFFLNADML